MLSCLYRHPLRRHHCDDCVGSAIDELRIALQFLEAARRRDRIAILAHCGEMPGERLGGECNSFFERIPGGYAAWHVREAYAVARAGVLVHQCNVTCHHHLTAVAACLPAYKSTLASSDASPCADGAAS